MRNKIGRFEKKDWNQYIGRTFGDLTLIGFEPKQGRNTMVRVQCRCSNIVVKPIYGIIKGTTTSCGCRKYREGLTNSTRINLTNKLVGRLTPMEYLGKIEGKNPKTKYWRCCCACGTQDVIVASEALTNKHTLSCGCLQKERVPRGENHPQWDKSITSEERQYRIENRRNGDPAFKSWSLKVKERDSFTCQICKNDKSGALRSHHLYNWKDYPDKRYDLDNGVCLCKTCHDRFHEEFGVEFNTPQEFEEFKRLIKF